MMHGRSVRRRRRQCESSCDFERGVRDQGATWKERLKRQIPRQAVRDPQLYRAGDVKSNCSTVVECESRAYENRRHRQQ